MLALYGKLPKACLLLEDLCTHVFPSLAPAKPQCCSAGLSSAREQVLVPAVCEEEGLTRYCALAVAVRGALVCCQCTV